jgi:beta-N-acetylhexosaminidase
VLDMPREHFDTVEFPPFRAAIDAGVEMVMLSHTIYPNLGDDALPASMSPVIIRDVLRGELGFAGVVYTDDISMLAISNRWGVPTACAMAFEAGNDMILMKVNHELTPAVRETVRFVREGRIAEEQITASVRKVLDLKRRHGMFERKPFDRQHVLDSVAAPEQVEAGRRLARKAVLCLKNAGELLPLDPARFEAPLVVAARSRSVCVSNDPRRSHDMLLNSVRRHLPGAFGTVIDMAPTRDQVYELGGLVKNADLVIFMLAAVRSGEAATGQESPVLDALGKVVAGGKPAIVLLTGAPYVAAQLPDAVAAVVCCFGISPLTIDAAVDLMAGEIPSVGRLPVHISAALPRGFHVAVPQA